jgi:hypothetical protein
MAANCVTAATRATTARLVSPEPAFYALRDTAEDVTQAPLGTLVTAQDRPRATARLPFLHPANEWLPDPDGVIDFLERAKMALTVPPKGSRLVIPLGVEAKGVRTLVQAGGSRPGEEAPAAQRRTPAEDGQRVPFGVTASAGWLLLRCSVQL